MTDVGLAELLAATFPGGSVTGAPKIAALDLIARLEPVGRGASMGALGVVRGNGDLELALTIRTFAVADGRIHLWVGGGIVWDSDPPEEVEESLDEGASAARGDRRAAAASGWSSASERRSRVAVGGRGVVDPAEPVLRADDEALLRGRAAFETLRVYGGAAVPARRAPRAAGARRQSGSACRRSIRPELDGLARPGARGAGDAGRRAAPRLDARRRRSARRLVSALPGHLDDAARARPAADLAARRPRRRAVAPPRREVDELRGQHGRRGGGAAARRRRRRLRRRARRSCSKGRRRTSGGAGAARCFTPSLDLGILAGVTRAAVIELARGRRVRRGRGRVPARRARAAPTRRSRPLRCGR